MLIYFFKSCFKIKVDKQGGRRMSQRKEMLMKNMEFGAYEGLNGKPGFK